MKSIIVTTLIIVYLIPGTVFAQSRGEAVYGKACASCHKTGITGAPILGDKKVWASRTAEGMDKMYESAINGKGAMPAKGGQKKLTDDEVKAAVDYMIEKSK